MVARILQGVLDFVGILVNGVLSSLPDSPFVNIGGIVEQYLRWLNYFVPVGDMITLMSAYLGAVGVWYGVRWVLRFARYIK
ncbi:MAG: hypothetical protein ACPL5F_01020 [Moorellaceae bacterium]